MDRSQKVLRPGMPQRARLLAESRDAVADAAESLAEAPLASFAPVYTPAAGGENLWTVAGERSRRTDNSIMRSAALR